MTYSIPTSGSFDDLDPDIIDPDDLTDDDLFALDGAIARCVGVFRRRDLTLDEKKAIIHEITGHCLLSLDAFPGG